MSGDKDISKAVVVPTKQQAANGQDIKSDDSATASLFEVLWSI
jgi:hypothetical protein